jgi:hypothetical protein
MRWRLWLGAAATLPLITLALTSGGLAPAGAARSPRHAAERAASPAAVRGGTRTTGAAAGNPFCKHLGRRYQASSGARMFCFGPRLHVGSQARPAAVSEGPGAPRNVDAASFAEDVNPAGVQADGQSETSIAASGPYVAEEWNDSTGFFSPCPSPMAKEELSGFGFSANGGKSFTDLGGLPNAQCTKDVYEGDPSVAAYRVGGSTYFYFSSLFDSPTGIGRSRVAMDACKVVGAGSAATLSCGQPIIVGSSTQCQKFNIAPRRTARFCSFIDKDFMTIDPARGRLYVSYTDFLLHGNGGTRVELAACDLGSASGGAGPAGGTPGAPVCEHGTPLAPVGKHFQIGKPYFTVASPGRTGCEHEGAYPAVDPATGAVFVAYEFNLFTDLFAPCNGATTPTAEVMTRTPLSCLPLAAVAACQGPTTTAAEPIKSLNATPVPGYNRFASNDFPRLAVSDPYRTVSMVWNDTRYHPLGDILLESFGLGTLRPVQAVPVVLDRPASGGLHMFPAMRTATSAGLLDVAWYSRTSATTADTSVSAALGVSPRTTTPPRSNLRITSVASNWDNATSIITPNFGDYIDEALSTTGMPPYVGSTLYIAWSDGRFSVPQPFEAHLPG